MDQEKIGAFIRELRKERNMTQEQLAEVFNEVHDAYSIILTLMQGCRKKMRGYYKANNPM